MNMWHMRFCQMTFENDNTSERILGQQQVAFMAGCSVLE